MAITFTTPIPTDRFIFSEENRIVEFTSDNTQQPKFCDITIGVLASLRLYPLPSGDFWCNLKEYISPLLRNYADTIDPTTIDETDVNTFVFDWARVYLNQQFTFTITFADDTTETTNVTPYIILGAEQLKQYKRGRTVSVNSMFVLSPLKKDTANTYHMRYWEGYPFDLCLSRDIPTIINPQQITNLTNGVTSPSISTPYGINRIFISDGDTNVTLEDYLPLATGYNKLDFIDNVFVELWKHQSDCGVYIKWLNQYGGYNYWLFNKQEQIDKNTRNIGVINNDFENLDSTVSQFSSLGKTSADSHRALADHLTQDDIDILQGVLDSPKVYYFAGAQFARNSFNNWIEIQVNNGRETVQNPREQNYEFFIEFTMPEDYTIRL